MRKSLATLLLLAAAVLTPACDDVHARGSRRTGGAADKSVTINKTWPAADIERLRVAEVDGTITVEAADTSEISLVAVATGSLELKPEKENQGLFETSIDGDTLRIGRRAEKKKFHFLWDKDDLRIEYRLKVPAGLELDMNTVNGRITTRGIEGDTEATSVNGTIDIEVSGENELQATTVNGRVKARFLREFTGAKFRTVNGGVEATLPQSASFSVDLAQVNGDFEAAFPLSVHSNPGRRRVSGDVNGGQHSLKIVTVNGDVELAKLGEQK